MRPRHCDRRSGIPGIVWAIVCLIALALPAGVVYAAGTYAVDSPTDPASGSGTASHCQTGHAVGICTLRDAIAAATADPGATVTVPSGTYTLNHGDPADPIQSSGIVISQPMSLIGVGSSSVIIQAATTQPPLPSSDPFFNPYYRVFEVTGGPTSIRGVTVRYGDPSGSCTGGGIKVTGAAATVTESVITQNVSCQDGGGIQLTATGSSLTVDRSTISANQADGNSGAIDGGTNSGLLIVRNSTLFGNTAGGNFGGAITTGAGGAQLLNTTITQNAAAPNGTGGGITVLSTLTIQNTIIAGNTNAFAGTPSPDIDNEGIIASNGNNLIGIGDATDNPVTFQLSDQHGTVATPLDPKLDTQLRDNGGPTTTLALLMGSSATGQGNATACNTLTAPGVTGPVDQRGAPRSASCSIGAFEPGSVQTITTLAATLSTLTYGQNETLTATVKGVLGGLPTDGTIAFKDGGTVISGCATQPISGGSATCMITALTVSGSPHMLTAIYTPGTNYATSTSAPSLNVTVTPAPITVTADAKNRSYGAANPPLTFTAMPLINGDTIATAFTGALATTATTASPVSGSPYPITQGTLRAPNYTITFVPASLTIIQATTATVLMGAPNPATAGQTVTLTATVTSAGGAPTGTVMFTDITNAMMPVSLGVPAMVNGMGTATLTTTTLTAGTHTFSATYSGGPNFSGSSATPIILTINGTTPAPTVTSLTLTASTGPNSGNTGTATNAILKPGASFTLSLIGRFSDNSTGPVSGVIFTSSDPTKVSVNPTTGVITALAPTTTPVTITATAPNGVMTTITVAVGIVSTGGLTNPNPAPMSHTSGTMGGTAPIVAPTRHADSGGNAGGASATVLPVPASR